MTIFPKQMAEATRLWTQFTQIGLDSQMVIGMRVAGMMGLLPSHKDEPWRMVQEKLDAAQEAGVAIGQAIWRGETADRVMAAALTPYGKRTNANARRLSRAATRHR
ncbi:MAG: antibiotic ABC transporter [Paracoccus sp. (in: a-proteobacteria)]